MSNITGPVADRIGPLVDPLHTAFELARMQLDRDHSALMSHPDQGWLRTHGLRGLLFRHLSVEGALPVGWQLTGNHRKNGSIHLASAGGEIVMKFVHVFPSGETPTAGTNRERRAFYTNRALAEIVDPNHMPTHQLLLRWEEQPDEQEFLLDVVRPLEPGRIGRTVKSDLCFPLPRTRSAFEGLQFDTRDDDEFLEFELGDTGSADDDD